MEEQRAKLEKLIALGWLIAAVVALAGCASKDIRRVNNLSVPVGQTSTAIIGVPFVSHEYGTVESPSVRIVVASLESL
jgi:hypothetical protein